MKKLITIISAFERDRAIKSLFLQKILGKTLLSYTFELAKKIPSQKIIFVKSPDDKKSEELFKNENLIFLEYPPEVVSFFVFLCEKIAISSEDEFLVLSWKTPLLSLPTIRSLFSEHKKKGNVLTYLNSKSESIRSEIFILNGKIIQFLKSMKDKKRETLFSLNNLVSSLKKNGEKVGEVFSREPEELISIRNKKDLPKVAETLRLRKIKELQEKGVHILDPSTTWIDYEVRIGKDTTIYPFNVIEGNTSIGKKCVIHPFSHIRDSSISDGVKILSSSVIEGAKIMKDASIGPYSRIRPNTLIESNARIGNFVEVKNTVVGKRSKALHLTYLGDAKIGSDVNVGAGTITCNFDGKNKNITIIESGAFIGSGTELVAPVKVGKKSYIGAGSTITKDVPPYALGIARERQTNIEKWVKRKKE